MTLASASRRLPIGVLRLVLWTVVGAACATILVVRSARSREYYAAVEARQVDHLRLAKETSSRLHRDRLRRSEVLTLLHGHDLDLREGNPPRREPPREEVQRLLNAGEPFRVLDGKDGLTTETWADPITGHEWELRFRRDKLTAAYVSRRAAVFQPPPPPLPKEPSRDRFEAYRRLLVGFYPWHGVGPIAWAVLVGVWALAKPYRRPLSELVLATAVICTTFWLAHPGFAGFTSWRAIFSNDPLVWASLMLLAGAACVVKSYRFPPAGPDLSHPFDWQKA